MTTISERLRETPGEFRGATALELQAADTIDALVAALVTARRTINGNAVWDKGARLVHPLKEIDAALALARGGK